FPFDLERSSIDVDGIDDALRGTMPLLEHWGIPARLTSLQGFEGCHEGYVTDLADAWLRRLDTGRLAEIEVFACG
ncbi:MAG: dihydroorotate dehydrogenase electron transfer subunit, partial [Acidobacteria bacterium]|nr:dihydroorotate dehydrogenase electron transfer subunit [Acidobacteriota bacterium]NIQ31571.1 dihydroorotate dehydrogenase electron transfer subunit [Acidobacteriota bacterium]